MVDPFSFDVGPEFTTSEARGLVHISRVMHSAPPGTVWGAEITDPEHWAQAQEAMRQAEELERDPYGGLAPVPAYRSTYCKRVVLEMSQGDSLVQAAARMGIPLRTIQQWGQQYPAFGYALERAHDLSQAWWESRIRQAAETEDKIPAAIVKSYMGNKFGYSDRTDTKAVQTLDVRTRNMSDEEIDQTLASLMAAARG